MKYLKYIWPVSALGTGVGSLVIFRDSLQGPPFDPERKRSLAGRTVIVTGASNGIGKATALELAYRGGRVILACKDLESGCKVKDEIIEETCNTNIHAQKLDLSSFKSIIEFSSRIRKDEKRLDVLINNAGVMGGKRQVTEDGIERNLAINFLGPFLLTQLLLPKLKSSLNSRVVNVSCAAQERGKIEFKDLNSLENYNYYTAYSQSKRALLLFTLGLAEREKGVISCAVDPGTTHTSLATGSKSASMWKSVFAMFTRVPKNACQSIIFCCLDPSVASGKYYKDSKEIKNIELECDLDQKRLWMVADKWTRLKDTLPSMNSEIS